MRNIGDVKFGITDNFIFTSNKKDLNFDSIKSLEKLTKKQLGDDGVSIAKEKIKNITTYSDKDFSVFIDAKGMGDMVMLNAGSEEEQKRVVEEVKSFVGKDVEVKEKEAGFFKRAGAPIIISVAIAVITGILYMVAGSLAGEEMDFSGKNAGKKRALAALANFLGPNGTLIIGAILTVLCVMWAVKKNKQGFTITTMEFI